MLNKAKRIVVENFNNQKDKTDSFVMTENEVCVVWFSKTLQNWKALLSTTVSDGMYYEVTYNGDKKETYLESYKKWSNRCIPDEQIEEVVDSCLNRSERPITVNRMGELDAGQLAKSVIALSTVIR